MAQGSTKGVPIDIDATLAADSDELVASQKAIKTYVDTEILAASPPSLTGNALKYLRVNAGETATEWATVSGGVTDFTDLGDVPASYAGQALKVARVNAGETALEFAVIAGTGDVVKVGTPVNNQVGVWTGDGTIEGDAALTFDTTTDTLTSGTFNGTALTASELLGTDASKNIVSLPVATYPSQTELSYVKGTTSTIQTQINGKEPTVAAGTSAQYYRGDKTWQTLDKTAVGLGNVVNADTTTTANITDSANKRFITDAQQTVLGNTSGTNTGDQTSVSGNAGTATTLQTAREINGVSFNGSADIVVDPLINIFSALGSTIKATTPTGLVTIGTGSPLTSQTARFNAIYLPADATLTGVCWMQVAQGSYTANNYNGVGLYTYSGGTLTLVASSTNDGNIWKATANSFATKAFTSTYAAQAGLYFIGLLYSNSAQTTAPTLIGGSVTVTQAMTLNFTNSAKIHGTLGGQTALPSPQASSGITASNAWYWLGLY